MPEYRPCAAGNVVVKSPEADRLAKGHACCCCFGVVYMWLTTNTVGKEPGVGLVRLRVTVVVFGSVHVADHGFG